MQGEATARRRLNPSQRKELLMKDAIAVFARRGIGRAGHTEIAQLAGVSVATVFNYFNTREVLVDEVLDEVENFLINLSVGALRQGKSAEETLNHCISTFINACHEQADYIKIWLEWSSSVREDTWPRYLKFQEHLLKLIEKQISYAINDGKLSASLPAADRARWALGNAHMLVSMVFSPAGKDETEIRALVSRGFSHILGVTTTEKVNG